MSQIKKLEADVVVLGAGTAGMGAFRNALLHTPNVYLIESNQYGTTCARVGCMPSKLLIAAAEARHHALHTDPFGIHLDKNSIEVNGIEVMNRVKSERDRFVSFVVSDVEEWSPEKRIMGQAKFLDEHTIQVIPKNNQNNQKDEIIEITAKRIVIATGSRPLITPEWAQLGDRCIVNDDVFSWDTLPESVAVFGTGVIALELGQALTRLGVRVEMFNRSESLGGLTDPIVREKAKEIFSAEIPLHLNVETKVILNQDNKNNKKVEIHYQSKSNSHSDSGKQEQKQGVFVADYLLAAAGRVPNIDNIGLENLNIQRDKNGVPIVMNPLTMQTSIPHIFIAGDASNQLNLLHEAADQGKIAGENAGKFPNINNGLRRSPIGIVFTSPQIAFVGKRFSDLNLDLNNLENNNIVIGEVSFNNQGRSRVMLVNKGHLRVYADKHTGQFLGAEMCAPAAEHLAHLLAWAHQLNLTIPQMLDLAFYHPVIEEGLRTALRDVNSKLLK